MSKLSTTHSVERDFRKAAHVRVLLGFYIQFDQGVLPDQVLLRGLDPQRGIHGGVHTECVVWTTGYVVPEA